MESVFCKRGNTVRVRDMDVCLDQKPPRQPFWISHVLQAWISSLPISCLSLLQRELALKTWPPMPFGRQSPSKADAPLLTSPPRSLCDRSPPLPPPLQALPPTAFSILGKQFNHPSLPAGTPSPFLPLCWPLLLPFHFHLIHESFTNGFFLGQNKTKDCKEGI